jgi:hypothetical protein
LITWTQLWSRPQKVRAFSNGTALKKWMQREPFSLGSTIRYQKNGRGESEKVDRGKEFYGRLRSLAGQVIFVNQNVLGLAELHLSKS